MTVEEKLRKLEESRQKYKLLTDICDEFFKAVLMMKLDAKVYESLMLSDPKNQKWPKMKTEIEASLVGQELALKHVRFMLTECSKNIEEIGAIDNKDLHP